MSRLARSVRAGATAVILAVWLTAPAAAAPSPGGDLMPRWVAAQKVGACVVRTNRRAATRFALANAVVTDPGSPEAKAARTEIGYALENCMGGDFRSVHLAAVELGGSMAETLLKEDSAALLARARTTAARPAVRTALPAPGAANVALFACATATDPGHAAGLLDLAPGATGEAAAFAALAPALQACAPADAELHIKPANVRWLVAMSLLRLVQTGT